MQQYDGAGGRAPALLAPLRWLGRKLSDLARWVTRRLPAPLRWLARLFAPGRERGFGFWWLVATAGVAVVLGIVIALLLVPVAGLIALLVVAIWALVHRRRRRRDDCDTTSPQPAADTRQRLGAPRLTTANADTAGATY